MVLAASSWMMPFALSPWLLGRAIDAGVVRSDAWATLSWVAVLIGVIAFGVMGGILFHTLSVRMWLYRIQRRVARRSAALGNVLNRRLPTGEVVSVSASDSDQFGATLDSFAHALAAVMNFLIACALMLHTSVELALIVLIATPLLLGVSVPVLRPLAGAQSAERTENSTLTSVATDIVTGLRILRGIGGEHRFAENYQRQSQKVRRLGTRLGTWQGVVEAISVLLSGLLLVVLVYLGSRQLLTGALTMGQLIQFLRLRDVPRYPMQAIFDFGHKWFQGLVSAGKTTIALQGVAWSPDGALVATADVSGLIRISHPDGTLERAFISVRPRIPGVESHASWTPAGLDVLEGEAWRVLRVPNPEDGN